MIKVPQGRTPVGRLRYVDSLRGVAAVGVLIHHAVLSNVFTPVEVRIFPPEIIWLAGLGSAGVEVFFVLSGLVVYMSLSSLRMDFRSIAKFALRRQLRLDPPYWLMVVAVLVMSMVEASRGLDPSATATPWSLVANLFYLHNLLGVPQILGVAWTLCLEVQFYLFAALMMFTASRLRWPAPAWSEWGPFLLLLSGLLAGGVALGLDSWHSNVREALFFDRWPFFVAGALLMCAMQNRCSRVLPAVAAAVLLVGAISPEIGLRHVGAVSGLFALLLIAFSQWWGPVANLIGGRPVLQYLGSRSYSLYLVHFPVIRLVAGLGYKISGEAPLMVGVWLVLAVLLSLASAELLFRCAEAPALMLAGMVRTLGVRRSAVLLRQRLPMWGARQAM